MTELSEIDIPASLAAAGAAIATLILAGIALLQTARRRRAAHEAYLVRAELDTVTARIREAVSAYDIDRRLIYLNPAFERLTGYTDADLQDRAFLHHIHPDDRAALLAEWDRLAGGGSLEDQEYRIVTQDGQIRWTSAAWTPIHDRAGHQVGHLATEFDITERKLAEAERLEDTELFQALLDVQRSVAAAGLDSRLVMQVIAEESQRLTGASGIVIETPADGSPSAAFRLGTTESPASTLTVELRDEQRSLGTLHALSSTPDAFTPRHTKALRLLSGLVGAALGHAAAHEARQHRLEQRTQTLQDSEQRFKHLIDAAGEGIWINDSDGTITYANRRFATMLGGADGTLLGERIGDFIDPACRSGALRLLADGAKGLTERREIQFAPRSGPALWALVSASPVTDRQGVTIGTVGFAMDITERKCAEERLQRSAERLAALHTMDRAMLDAHSPADVGRAALTRLRRMVPYHYGAVVLSNEDGTGRLIAGYTGAAPLAPETVPSDLFSPMSGYGDAAHYTADLQTIADPSPVMRHLLGQGLRTALTVPLLADSEPVGVILLAATEPDAFVADQRDVALETAAPLAAAIRHAQLRDAVAHQAAELERHLTARHAALRTVTAELETVLHAIAHDLRPPIRHVDSFAHLLLEETGPAGDPAVRHYAKRLQTSATRLATLVEDILRLSRVGRQDLMRQPVDLGALAEEVAGQLDGTLEGRPVRWEIDPLPVVDADPGLTRLALGELLANAVKFTASRNPAVIHVRPIRRDDQPGIAVQDNGVGFPMAHVSKLFGVFQRLHRADELTHELAGNGIGLALVQRIAHRHGGQVWADGDEGRGATFTMTFGPHAAGPHATAVGASPSAVSSLPAAADFQPMRP